MQGKAWGNEYRTTMVCVDDYDGQVLKGRLYNPFTAGMNFHSVMDFLIKMEDLLDNMKFPHSFTATRSFSASPERTAASPPGGLVTGEGKRATFSVRVLFRQNASWQGSVTWLERDRDESFRSVLELLLLMDSALRESENEKRVPFSPSCKA